MLQISGRKPRKVREFAAAALAALLTLASVTHTQAAATEKEPNEDHKQATPIKSSQTLLGYISDKGDIDTFKLVTGPSYKNVVQIELKAKAWGFVSGLNVTQEDGTVLFDSNSSARGDRAWTLSGRPKSTYYIKVFCKYECGNGDYTLALKPAK